MGISIFGVLINVFMLIIIIITLVFGFVYSGELNTCETQQSPYCYTIQCPCDSQSTSEGAPCFGYAKMPGPNPGQWYCSNAPLTLVDNNGNII